MLQLILAKFDPSKQTLKLEADMKWTPSAFQVPSASHGVKRVRICFADCLVTSHAFSDLSQDSLPPIESRYLWSHQCDTHTLPSAAGHQVRLLCSEDFAHSRSVGSVS